MTNQPLDQPWQLQFPPEKWQEIFSQALADLRAAQAAGRDDPEALQAMKDASEALSVYEEAEAASPAERIASGFRSSAVGLGKAAVDLPVGVASAVLHPIRTLQNLPKLPGQLYEGLTSDDPEQISRTVGNIGSFFLPSAKGSFRIGPKAGAGAATIGGMAARGVTAPFRAVGEMVKRPALRNQLILEATQRAREQAARAAAQRALAEAQIPQRAEAAGLANEAALKRIQILEQQIERGGPNLENLELRNELLRLKLGMEPGGPLGAPDAPAPPLVGDPIQALADWARANAKPAVQRPTPQGPPGARGTSLPEPNLPPDVPASSTSLPATQTAAPPAATPVPSAVQRAMGALENDLAAQRATTAVPTPEATPPIPSVVQRVIDELQREKQADIGHLTTSQVRMVMRQPREAPPNVPPGATQIIKQQLPHEAAQPAHAIEVQGASAMPQGPFPPTILEIQQGGRIPVNQVMFEEALKPVSPRRLIGPPATTAEIEAFIKSLRDAQLHGYPQLQGLVQ